MKQVCVNPGLYKHGSGYLKVEDDLGRVIKHKPNGNMVNKTTHISRLIKAGDLVLVTKEEQED